MKQILVLLFITSIFFSSIKKGFSQEIVDTIQYKERYGLRVGIDLSKPLRSLLEEEYQGFEIIGDYRVYDNYYLAAELGNEKLPFDADNLEVTASGSYIKIGADYNAYDNWAGMENLIIVGLRLGFSTFSQKLEQYTIYTRDQYFPSNIVEGPFESSGLTATWIEFLVGAKVEVLHNVYLGANVQLKRRVAQSTPSNFDNLVIPGFGRTYDESSFGVGYSYNISYLIPLYRKAKD